MKYNLCVFEDTKYRNFLPLTYLRPAYDLVCGLDTLLEKISRYIPHGNIILHTRPHLKDQMKQRHLNALINRFAVAGHCLFINGRALLKDNFLENMAVAEEPNKETLFINQNDELVAMFLSDNHLAFINEQLQAGPLNSQALLNRLKLEVRVKRVPITLLEYPWQLLKAQATELKNDFQQVRGGVLKGEIDTRAILFNEEQIYIAEGSVIEPFVVLDARQGPIYIDRDVKVEAHSLLKGPLYIGPDSQINSAHLENIYCGMQCRLGGEIKNTIMLGYTNKAHAGFLGDSYLGQWINLGALTTNSNLKNTYGNINMTIDGNRINTKEQFLGCILGDFTKTGIGTLITTGLVVGISCNLLNNGLAEARAIPSFIWTDNRLVTDYKLVAMEKTAERMMSRRQVELSDVQKGVLHYIFEHTKNEREHFIKEVNNRREN